MPELTPAFLVLGFISYMVFLFSTTCHEAAHAFVAQKGGDSTAALGGQVSLNPIPHIRRSPYGMVVFPLLSFFVLHGGMIGFASAPFDPNWERRYPKRSALMALAGPATNFTLMLLGAFALRAGRSMDLFHRQPDGTSGFLFTLFFTIFSLNLLLGTFNLLPLPPLDGSAAIMLLMSESRAQKYLDFLRGNSFAMAGLLVGLFVFQRIFPYVQYFVMHLLF